MIYGLNFNGTDIPWRVRMIFPRYLRLDSTGKDVQTIAKAHLPYDMTIRGVCETPAERDQMIMQADNGHRLIWTKRRGHWIAIYTN